MKGGLCGKLEKTTGKVFMIQVRILFQTGDDIHRQGGSALGGAKGHRPVKHIGWEKSDNTFLGLNNSSNHFSFTQINRAFPEFDPPLLGFAIFDHIRP